MTTNVSCIKGNTLASDSRWSFEIFDGSVVFAVAYVDNTGYDKISFDIDSGYIFAGHSELIDQWKKWVATDQTDPRPPVARDFAVCVTTLSDGSIFFEHGQLVQDENCRMAGTGAEGAYDCWSIHQDAKKAVESAKVSDIFSGGDVKYLHGEAKDHNLNLPALFTAIKNEFLKKGMVMYTNPQSKAIPIDEACANDSRIQTVRDNVANGSLAAKAPNGRDPVIWTPADEARLDKALLERAQRRASSSK